MNVPPAGYSLESFLEFIVNNIDEVFGGRQARKWLKIHLVYTQKNWRKIFESLYSEDYGEITRITMGSHAIDDNEKHEQNFYVHEWTPGLILMFTSSTEEDYERTLKQFISHQRGITESWIAPSLFDEMKNFLIQKYNAKIYRFISRRRKHWKFPSKIRPEVDRRHSYSGEDAEDTLKEVQTLYGVIPSSIDMRIGESQIQLNRNGLFVIRHVNRVTLGITQEVIERIVAEQVRIRDTSERFNVSIQKIYLRENEIKVPRIIAGRINFPSTKLSELMINQMFGQVELYEPQTTETMFEEEVNFSFTDTYVEEGPLIFSATVVDEIKGTVFGISGNESEIILVPKHRTTFESFISFYNLVTENFDNGARLAMFSEKINV